MKLILLSFFSAEISDDSSLIAIGFADSIIKVWSVTPSKLREMKPAEQLKDIDRDAGTVVIFLHFHVFYHIFI